MQQEDSDTEQSDEEEDRRQWWPPRNDSDEILVRLAFDHHHRARLMPRNARCVLATGDFARTNPLPYGKAIRIGTNICQTNTKPWNKESRISN